MREPVWNVEPVDVGELIAPHQKNPAAFQTRFERRVVRLRGRAFSVYDDSEMLGAGRAWFVLITSESAPSGTRSLACRLPSRADAAEISKDATIVVHGTPEMHLDGRRLADCVVEAVGGNPPPAVPLSRVTVASDFQEEIQIASRDLDSAIAADTSAAGDVVTVRAKLKNAFFGGAFLWNCSVVRPR